MKPDAEHDPEKYRHIWKDACPYLALTGGVILFCMLLLWIADIGKFLALAGLGAFFLAASALFIFFYQRRRRDRLQSVFRNVMQGDQEEALLYAELDAGSGRIVRELLDLLRKTEKQCFDADRELCSYMDYIEIWAHEIKLPLSLLMLILDHENTAAIEENNKLEHVRLQMNELLGQILTYHRIRGEKKDYLLVPILLEECVNGVLSEFALLLEETDFHVRLENLDRIVLTDRRALEFILTQLFSNACKYASEQPQLTVSCREEEDGIILQLSDNGIGVKPCDLPYIFERGFTGDSGNMRKKSTGMGLYLVKKLADDLNIAIEADSVWQQGFSIRLCFAGKRKTSG